MHFGIFLTSASLRRGQGKRDTTRDPLLSHLVHKDCHGPSIAKQAMNLDMKMNGSQREKTLPLQLPLC